MTELKEYSPFDKRLAVHGRTARGEGLELFWTGSGVEMQTDATELYFELRAGFGPVIPWVRVELDGETILRMTPEPGESRICAFRGVPAERRLVRFFREGQCATGNEDSVIAITSILCDGELFPLKPRPLRLEFVGDSVTSGEGLAGPRSLVSGGTAVYSSRDNYALLVGNMLNADVNIVAMSGWGAAVSWDNDPAHAMPRIYDQVCGALPGHSPAARSWDFASWQPDAVVVHLGNNDGYALESPPHFDPVTGIATKFSAGPDGAPDEASAGTFERAVTDFLKAVRRRNPRAHIAWAYGMLGGVWTMHIARAVAAYSAETGDGNVSFLRLAPVEPENQGSNGHPGPLDHAAAAKETAEHLRSHLNL